MYTVNVHEHNTQASTYHFHWEYVVPVTDSSVNKTLFAVEPFHNIESILFAVGTKKFCIFSTEISRFQIDRPSCVINGTYRNCCK
jgi:hypothetical protein